MAAMTDTMPSMTEVTSVPEQSPKASKPAPVTAPWIRAQSINVTRHAAALRPFKRDEFGSGSEAPTAGHIQAVNRLIVGLRRGLLDMSGKVAKNAALALTEPSTTHLQNMVRRKAHAHSWVRGIE